MRPRPPARHRQAVLILVAIVAANTELSFLGGEITDHQADMLAGVFKRADPGLYGSDAVFGPTGPGAPWRQDSPTWQSLLAGALWLGGAGDPLHAYRILGAAALLVYLLGMYALLYRQTHSSGVATAIAAMSMAVFSLRRPHWGLGPIFTVTPATLYLATVPLLVLGIGRLRRRWSVLAVFFAAGLAGNVHLASAINFVLVMAVVLLALWRFRGRGWALACLAIVAAAAGATPTIHHYLAAARAADLAVPHISLAQLRSDLELARMELLYPGILLSVLRWLPVAALLAVPASFALSRAGRYRLRYLGAWLWMFAAAMAVALGLQGLSQLIGWQRGTLPPTLSFFGALGLAMLPLYVVFAQAAVHLIRLVRPSRQWVQAGLGVFVAVYLASSYNTLPLRHMLRDAAAWVGREARASERPQEQAELLAIARWAGREDHTPRDALCLGAGSDFRLHARRSVLAGREDLRYFYFLAPRQIPDWAKALRAERELLNPPEGTPAEAERIAAFVAEHWRELDRPAAPTYALIRSRAAPAKAERLTELAAPTTKRTAATAAPATTQPLVEVAPPAGEWGRHWRLFRVLPAWPTSAGS